ncbi:MAG: 5-(carboxyamino)imidazole ribonucleotide synthase [Xanthomonadales bacterium]|nr:5-(carboxyamino)imidazole ribonucleotide synthase [Xanthomonadales bacterium]
MKVGVLGGGQLGRMMALAGVPLGQEFVFLDPAEDACAGVVGDLICAPYDDEAALAQLADAVDIVTYDFENVPVASARSLSDSLPVFPRYQALEVSQDRLREKTFFSDAGIPCALFASVDSYDDLVSAADEMGYPCVLKTRRMGYDGKGQRIIQDRQQVDQAWSDLGGQALILEAFVRFKRELSIIAARSTRGETVFYPLTENRHKDGILITSFAPANAGLLVERARAYAIKVLDNLDYCGVLTIEFFDVDDGLVANEMAPRVHNSGHWTIDGAVTSQFENHLRAIMGWPLGSTDPVGASAMLNWIGAMPDPSNALSYPNAHWHDYGKKPRAGRKVGHVTINAENILALQAELGKFALALGEQLKESGVEAFTRGH